MIGHYRKKTTKYREKMNKIVKQCKIHGDLSEEECYLSIRTRVDDTNYLTYNCQQCRRISYEKSKDRLEKKKEIIRDPVFSIAADVDRKLSLLHLKYLEGRR